MQMFLSDLAGCIVASEYYINKVKATWEEANESCQKNSSVLAVLDSQQKIEELSTKLKSLGYGNDMFWIGLLFNASTGQFVWSTGDNAQENFINSTCGINPDGNVKFIMCYLLKHTNTSPCFDRRYCRKDNQRYGYICQPASSKGKFLCIHT